MFYLNPYNPACPRSRPGILIDGVGSGNVSVPPAFRVRVSLGPSQLRDGVHLLPEADGDFILWQRERVTRRVSDAEPVDFLDTTYPQNATPMWSAYRHEKPPQSDDDPVEQFLPGRFARWHLAYGFDWTQFRVLGDEAARQELLDGMADFLFFLNVYGFVPSPDTLNEGAVEFPFGLNWHLWYGPDAEVADRYAFGIPFPYYVAECNATAFHPMQPPRMFKRQFGLQCYDAVDFPDFIDLEPFFP
ncbi:MAG: hypothetical protein KDA71_09765 [Planctomycetales bacterium]|nr:hypothetical protein [Planctomycetales bacterium]